MGEFSFRKVDQGLGRALLKAGKVRGVLFSEGTYQVEVVDTELKKSFWPFFQLDDAGKILDCFCTCKAAEKHRSCLHLAGAYLKIFNGNAEPLHVRFRRSLWNTVCQMGSKRHGYGTEVLKREEGGFSALSDSGKQLFFVKGLNEHGKKRLNEYILKRSLETEETSLKFSNLAPEELRLWQEGKPSHHLRYELSFWSDLAKWWMQLQEEDKHYKIEFDNHVPLPKWIKIHFAEVECRFYIGEVNWPEIIPSLTTVISPLDVFETYQRIKKITYDPALKTFALEFFPGGKDETVKGYPVGNWIFVQGEGFYPAQLDPILKEPVIREENIAHVLQRHRNIIQKYLTGTTIHASETKANYELFFDKKDNLHIRSYVFEPGDLQKPESAYFGPWVYIEGKGFYLLANLLFEGVEQIIKKNELSSFVNLHRHFLHEHEGFQTHISKLESQLTYSVSKEGVLRFDAYFDVQEEVGETIDLEDWLYIKGRGFYSKSAARNGAVIKPGLVIAPSEISTFIHAHREELEAVDGFFSVRCPIEKMGVKITLNEKKQIVITPEQFLHPTYKEDQIRIFGDYVYVKRQGFSEIPYESRLPDDYMHERVISASGEPYFIFHELESLRKYTLSIDPSLCRPKYLRLRIDQLKKDDKKKTGEWVVSLGYESDIGTVNVYDIWKAVQEQKRYLISPAGLLILKELRFNWLKTINKKRWIKKGKEVRLNTLEWLKLSIYEEIKEPTGKTKGAQESRRLLEDLRNFQSSEPLNLSGLQSHLRPYQEMGVRWLWFLYCRGLSGLLCDEMGLGKTHQAMALLAAAKNQALQSGKYLVVCPTSVIYHWEGLLKKFLPEMKVRVFYGLGRTLDLFMQESDLLLTSYGTLRSEKEALGEIPFDIAVFDEIQIAKNAHSQTHKALRSIISTMRLGLTGTPIENRLLELKALFDVVLPNYMPSDSVFKEFFVGPIEKNQDPERKTLLSRLIKPFILRRKKAEVLLELPEKIEEISYCDLSEEQRELYSQAFLSRKDSLMAELKDEKKPASHIHIFSLFSTLKQICDHPCLINKKFSEYTKHKSGKWELFVELLQETRDSGQKLVVFSQYLEMLDIIEKYLKEHGIGFAGIRGSTQNRKAQLDKFREDPSCEVFVGSLQAAGVGIDLIAASVVIHYDRWWNPAKENQATDRVHRMGQSRGVQVFKIVTKNTIEEHIHRMIEKKMGLMEGIIGFDEQDHIKGLDRKELIELLQLVQRDIES